MNSGLNAHQLLETKLYPESVGGLLLCGINSEIGLGASSLPQRSEPTFFSDREAGESPFRSRILTWFTHWGLPLETRRGCEMSFERAISKANWLDEKAVAPGRKSQADFMVEHPERFLALIEELRPSAIFFFGHGLGEVLSRLAQGPHRNEVEYCLGALKSDLKWLTRADPLHPHRTCQVGHLEFRDCRVLVFPHPTGAVSLSNALAASFAGEVHEALRGLVSIRRAG